MCAMLKKLNRNCCRLFLVLSLSAACVVVVVYRRLVVDLDFRFSSPCTDEDLRSLNLTLATLLAELTRLNVTYFMNSGTLLGSYRHHGRIPWDDDVDLMVNSSEKRLIYGWGCEFGNFPRKVSREISESKYAGAKCRWGGSKSATFDK